MIFFSMLTIRLEYLSSNLVMFLTKKKTPCGRDVQKQNLSFLGKVENLDNGLELDGNGICLIFVRKKNTLSNHKYINVSLVSGAKCLVA
jgi:hypothetical protein